MAKKKYIHEKKYFHSEEERHKFIMKGMKKKKLKWVKQTISQTALPL